MDGLTSVMGMLFLSSTILTTANTDEVGELDDYWDPWMEWGPCSVSCGTGSRVRQRVCVTDVTTDNNCAGFTYDVSTCQRQHLGCPVDGGWGSWGPWLACNCGSGIKVRHRACDSPAPSFNGSTCVGQNSDFTACHLKSECREDGAWSPWFNWTPCSAACGNGTRTRARLCDNPPPVYGGRACTGINFENMDCVTSVTCPNGTVDGSWSTWGHWGPCSATCGNGTYIRNRTCTDPAPHGTGLPCPGDSVEQGDCSTNNVCPIDGEWTNWGSFGPCSKTCGSDALRERQRHCSNPQPSYGGRDCEGISTDIRTCTYVDCTSSIWGVWQAWEQCSKSCGEGAVQVRSRQCQTSSPSNGASCIGNNFEVRPCNVFCPVDGAWANWLAWTPCSVSCESGTQLRARLCDNPAPQYGGRDCVGKYFENKACFMSVLCPSVWGDWQAWEQCSKSCGDGAVQIRKRLCQTSSLLNGSCVGDSFEIRPCHVSCPGHPDVVVG